MDTREVSLLWDTSKALCPWVDSLELALKLDKLVICCLWRKMTSLSPPSWISHTAAAPLVGYKKNQDKIIPKQWWDVKMH